jgi:hypothetical protein
MKKKIIFSVILILMMGVFVEIALQVHYRATVGRWLSELWAIPIFETDPIRKYRMKSNLSFEHNTREFSATYYTDSRGLRTDEKREEILPEKSSDTYRILFLGPSFTFGWGVDYEKTYVALIGAGLKIPGKSVQIMNLGTPSQPIPNQLCWLVEKGKEFQPDLIVQTVYGRATNIRDACAIPEKSHSVKNGYLMGPDAASFKSRVKRIRQKSAILFYGWHVYAQLRSPEEPGGDVGMGTELYDREKTAELSGNVDAIVETFMNYIDLARQSVGSEVPVVFVYVPFSYMVRPADMVRVNHKKHASPERVLAEVRTVADKLNGDGAYFVNPFEALIERDQEERTFYLVDIHFTEAGNEVTAKAALPVVQQAATN